MAKSFELVFDIVIRKQLIKAAKNQEIKTILTKSFDKLELIGPTAGKLLDSKLYIYEIKYERPPIRIYFKHNKKTNEIYVFEYEMKTSEKKQKKTINKLRKKLKA